LTFKSLLEYKSALGMAIDHELATEEKIRLSILFGGPNMKEIA
jgi:hypothetical protein